MTGAEATAALEFAVKHLNGIAGRPVEVLTRDAQGTSSGATDAARMLVEEGVVAIFGPNQAGQKTAVSEYCAEAGNPPGLLQRHALLCVCHQPVPDRLRRRQPPDDHDGRLRLQ